MDSHNSVIGSHKKADYQILASPQIEEFSPEPADAPAGEDLPTSNGLGMRKLKNWKWNLLLAGWGRTKAST